ncbi:MAG: hypothetical protein AAF213_05505 [Pseudomonadota bacterium]
MFFIWALAFMLVGVFKVAAEAPWVVLALIILVFYAGKKDKKKDSGGKDKKKNDESTMVRSLDDVLGPEAGGGVDASGRAAVNRTVSLDVFSPADSVSDDGDYSDEAEDSSEADPAPAMASNDETDKGEQRGDKKSAKKPDLTEGQVADIQAVINKLGMNPEKDAVAIFGGALKRALVYLPISLFIGVLMLSPLSDVNKLSLVSFQSYTATNVFAVYGFAAIGLFIVSIEFWRDGEDGHRIPLKSFMVNIFGYFSKFVIQLFLLALLVMLIHVATWAVASIVSYVFDWVIDLFAMTRGDSAPADAGQTRIDFVYLVTYILLAAHIYPAVIGFLNGDRNIKLVDERIRKVVRDSFDETFRRVSNLVFVWIALVYLIFTFTNLPDYLSSAVSTLGVDLHPNIFQVVLTFQLCLALLAGISGYAGRRLYTYGAAAQKQVLPSVETASASSLRPHMREDDFDHDPHSRFTVHRAALGDQEVVRRFLERSYTTLLVKYYDEQTRTIAIPKMSAIGKAMLASGRFYLLEDRETGALAGVGGWRFRRTAGDESPTTAVIRLIEVHPDNINQGADNILLGRIMHEAKTAGITDLMAYTALHNERFYLDNGFNTVRLIDKPLGNDVVFPLLEMHYCLTSDSKDAP